MPKRDFFKRTQRKRYQARKPGNPYFRKKRGLPWQPIVITGVSIGAVLAVMIFFFTNSAFRIRKVDVRGLEYISSEDVQRSVTEYIGSNSILFFKKTNRFLFSTRDLKTKIETDFALANVTIGLSADIVTITLKERTSNLLWSTDGKIFVADLEGVAVRKLYGDVGEDDEAQFLTSLPFFYDKNNVDVQIGKQVMTEEEIGNIFLFHEHLAAQGIEIINTSVDRIAGKWMSVRVGEGYEILFDATGDISAQAERLDLILLEQIENISELEYIDLRFGDHVYYR